MLDEIDKLGADRSAATLASALVEVLDPEQNFSFSDHYLDVRLTCPKCMFIVYRECAATPFQRPARSHGDHLELSGYTTAEKLQIARNHLMAELLERSMVWTAQLRFQVDEAVR
jgi:ATP-dependent Lon protease